MTLMPWAWPRKAVTDYELDQIKRLSRCSLGLQERSFIGKLAGSMKRPSLSDKGRRQLERLVRRYRGQLNSQANPRT